MTLGQTESTDLGKRDAFHVCCVLVKAAHGLKIKPGRPVRFINNLFKEVVLCEPHEMHGIVDPFSIIGQGDYFWVILKPNSTEKLVHNFDIHIKDVPEIINSAVDDEEEDDDDDYGCKHC